MKYQDLEERIAKAKATRAIELQYINRAETIAYLSALLIIIISILS